MEYIREKTDCMYLIGAYLKDAYMEEHMEVEKWEENGDTFIRTTIKTPKGDLTKLDRKPADINTVWHIEHLVKDESDIERFLSIPNDPKEVDISHIKERERYLGDRGVMMVDFADPLCIVAELFEFGDFTIKAFVHQDLFTKLLDKVFELQIYYLKSMLQKGAGPLFRIVGPEYATAPYLSTEYFHKYVCQYDRQIIQLIHDYGQYARIHCHGRVRNIMPHIIEMEADAIDPLEAPPSGDITLSEVKEKYGKDICLMGNIQLRDLEYCHPEEMRAIVIDCMRAAKEGGNYVLLPTAAPINTQLSPVTEENYMIMIDTALEYGQY
jgi:uroporphyrinogen-III decarboxylase